MQSKLPNLFQGAAARSLEAFMDGPLLRKSKEFSSRIAGLCLEIQREKREYVMSKQLLRSGTSVGANIREAQNGGGLPEFIHKLRIALRECDEPEFWMETLSENGFEIDESLFALCVEIKKMLKASINTASGKL